MFKSLLPLALLLVVTQRTAALQLPEVVEMALVGVALLGVASLLRRARRVRPQNSSAVIVAHSTRRLHGGRSPGAGRAAA